MNRDAAEAIRSRYRTALRTIWDRSGYDRGFISNPFAGDDAARLGLDRTRAVLADLGNPDQRLKLIHVAGSKGKGSTTILIEAILRASGMRVGRFISPHLHSYRERFLVDGELIGEDDFAVLTEDVMAAVESAEANHPEIGEVTAWELSTAMALEWFARTKCDVAVIEVGLGGTLDATNVIDPIVSAITRLDFEHTAILGDTLAEIASNKAGIIKPGRPAVTVEQPKEALDVIIDRAQKNGSPLLIQNRDWFIEGEESGFSVSGPWGKTEGLRTSLVGRHQIENAALAVAAIKLAYSEDNAIFDSAIRQGLLDAQLAGRFERVQIKGKTVIIDGAHTPISAAALTAALVDHYPENRVAFAIGMLADKRPDPFLIALLPQATRWFISEPASPRRMSLDVLRHILDSHSQRVDPADSIAQAIDMALDSDVDVVVVTGSLTTVAEARVHLGLGIPDPPPT